MGWCRGDGSLSDLTEAGPRTSDHCSPIGEALVATGRLNKQIAAGLGVSEITVKVHLRQVMSKMHASSVPDLARMADRLKVTPGKPQSL
jgi:Bacterial regulatory proteins, luxR family